LQKNIKIVDLPGEDRLRNKFFDQYKSSAKGIVYVLDSSTVQKTLRDVAESLYVILADPQVQSSRVNILVCCNKQDQTLAKSSSVVKTLLQKEL
jgi:Predicted GTPase